MSENNAWRDGEENPGGPSHKDDENGKSPKVKRPIYSTREDVEKRPRRPRKVVDGGNGENPREYKHQNNDRYSDPDSRFPSRDNRYPSRDTNYPAREPGHPMRDNSYPQRDSNYTPREPRFNPREANYIARDNRRSDQGNRYNQNDNRNSSFDNRRQDNGNRYQPRTDRPERSGNYNRDDSNNRYDNRQRPNDRPSYQRNDRQQGSDRPFKKQPFRRDDGRKPSYGRGRGDSDAGHSKQFRVQTPDEAPILPTVYETAVRLNKFIANAGICSRREADKLIIAGAVTVNNVVVTTLGARVNPGDKVMYGDQTLTGERKFFVLLNKPKNFITTMDDPKDRKTVMALVRNACRERIFPVGRLDRNTTGLLLLTNDGEIAKKLTHPSSRVRKVYHVTLDRPLSRTDMVKISDGIDLEDGNIVVDAIAYVGDGMDKKQIGIEIHSGKNRIVRRIFESLDYNVVKLDRVVFAGLTKKDLPRGHWRYLNLQEINFLKMI